MTANNTCGASNAWKVGVGGLLALVASSLLWIVCQPQITVVVHDERSERHPPMHVSVVAGIDKSHAYMRPGEVQRLRVRPCAHCDLVVGVYQQAPSGAYVWADAWSIRQASFQQGCEIHVKVRGDVVIRPDALPSCLTHTNP